MPKFKVRIQRTENWEVVIEADNEPLATALSWELYADREEDEDCRLVDEEDVHEYTIEVTE